MEVAIPGSNNGSGGCSPFQREVREWQRIDPNTGALLTGRLEADRWINGPLNTYGKVVDSQNVSQPNGTQHTQRKQLEVLQARTASGAMQVIRAQTVQHTSSRWSSSSGTNSPSSPALAAITNSCSTKSSSSLFNNAATTITAAAMSNSSLNNNSCNQRFTNHSSSNNTNNNNMNKLITKRGFLNGNSPLMMMDMSSATNGHMLNDADIYEEEEHSHLTSNFLNHQRRQQHSHQNHQLGLGQLLNTAPSLKLSNLMKSSSSVSSCSSINSNSTTTNNSAASTKVNQNANISLRSLGRQERNGSTISSSMTPAMTTTTTTTSSNSSLSSIASSAVPPSPDMGYYRHRRRYDHHPTTSETDAAAVVYVGGSDDGSASAGVDDGGCDDDGINRRSLPPTQQSQPQQQNQHHCLTLESFRQRNVDNDPVDTEKDTLQSYQLQRGRSVSTDDLTTDWDLSGTGKEETTEWRRVSKLRRSFQSTTSSGEAAAVAATSRRPVDLPESSVSVSKIRAELENGRRLNTAMRNNHVDLAALDTILNGTNATETSKSTPKRTSFLTAESLKEIRGKLKKLSDESLYKDDFIAQHQPPPDLEDLEIREIRLPPTGHKEPGEPGVPSAFQFVPQHQYQREKPPTREHTTNSLENRLKSKDTNSNEWHLRRKSYGFEKMSPPDKTMFRLESSTDSGIGRSGELGNWSPTESTSGRGTVITFGQTSKNLPSSDGGSTSNAPPLLQRRFRTNRLTTTNTTANAPTENNEIKRHSIAVDESQYVRDNLRKTSIHLNGFYNAANPPSLPSQSLTGRHSDSPPPGTTLSTASLFNRKRVEFCKTEVHFAAESGRVNIVETDGKPPPTNNFRRRRRTASGPLTSIVKPAAVTAVTTPSISGYPVVHFGDNELKTTNTASSLVSSMYNKDELEQEIENLSTAASTSSNVTVSIPVSASSNMTALRNSHAFEASDTDADETLTIRGILKNKPIKPKPYHLGEHFESPDALWGVQMKPLSDAPNIQQNRFTANEKDLTPAVDDKDFKELLPAPLPSLSAPLLSAANAKSVAEHIRIVEDRKDITNGGYSTKINLNLSNSPYKWTEIGSVQYQREAQSRILQDLKTNQQILDQGLKSTSLIIKTMRSASEFDEAMRRLSISSGEAVSTKVSSVENPSSSTIVINSIRATNGIHHKPSKTTYIPIDDNSVQSSGYSCSPARKVLTGVVSTFNHQHLTGGTPIAAPRLKVIGNSDSISHQLSQLRRMYDVAAAQEEDSADEEVKGYFGGSNSDSGGTHDNSSVDDEKSTEWSGSWSRIKAKKTILKTQTKEDTRTYGHQQQQEELQYRQQKQPDIPKSNVMNIELHSPQATLRKLESVRINQQPPVAKPRTISALKQTQTQQKTENQSNSNSSHAETSKSPLKIIKEARGARKLREHELSYFGVKVSDNNSEKSIKPQVSKMQTTMTTNPKRTLPSRKLTENATNKTNTTAAVTKWNLVSDKPDLLRHSTIAIEPAVTTEKSTVVSSVDQYHQRRHSLSSVDLSEEEEEEEGNEVNNEAPIYGNLIGRPVAREVTLTRSEYSRKADTERDEMILNEMTRTADQTMKAISDEAALKEQRRRSFSRRSSKPLETIEEKYPEKREQLDSCVSVKVSRGTIASEARKSPRNTTPSPTSSYRRTSSASSGENIPIARPRSRTRSNDVRNPPDYVNLKPKIRTTSRLNQQKTSSSRSSSRESQRSNTQQYSSSEDLSKRDTNRMRTRLKRSTAMGPLTTTSTTRTTTQQRNKDKNQQLHITEDHERHRNRSARTSTTTTTTNKVTPRSSTRDRADGHDHHNKSSRTSRRQISSGSSKATGDLDHSQKRSSGRSVRTVGEKVDKSASGGGNSNNIRPANSRADHDSSNQSSNRSERTATATTTREKVSRSKGEPTQSTSISEHHQSNNHQHPSSPLVATSLKSRSHTSTDKKTGTISTSGHNSDKGTHSKNSSRLIRTIARQ